jgi:hypothetical protein
MSKNKDQKILTRSERHKRREEESKQNLPKT